VDIADILTERHFWGQVEKEKWGPDSLLQCKVHIQRTKLAAKTDPIADVDTAVVQPEQARPVIGRMLAKEGKKHRVGAVPMTVDQILAETNGWPKEQIEMLVERLLMSNYRLPDPAVDAAWAEEIKRRIDDIESGREVGIPGEEVMARMRKIVGL
jgi:putative addiction module component (TIGR02574 family)